MTSPTDKESAALETLRRIAHVLNTAQVRWEGDTVLACISALVTAGIAKCDTRSAGEGRDPLVTACRGLISYWTRNLRNFQWEKADEHVKRINIALDTFSAKERMSYDSRGEVPVLVDRNDVIEECAMLIEHGECQPGCDSYAHDDLCPVVNPEAAIRALKTASPDRNVQPK